MNFLQLIKQRADLVRQARLANVAYAYRELSRFAQRVERGNLRGEVELRESAPESECYWATLTAVGLQQSVIDEHFDDQDIVDLADLVAFATDAEDVLETFRIEDLRQLFAEPLKKELQAAGVAPDSVSDPDSGVGAERA
jgi:hypothetical protein